VTVVAATGDAGAAGEPCALIDVLGGNGFTPRKEVSLGASDPRVFGAGGMALDASPHNRCLDRRDHLGPPLRQPRQGHATFLAGLIRLTAPDAQVISVKLMSDDGTLSDDDLASALDWLTQYAADGHVIDVVLMAFGRPKEPGEDNPDSLVRQFGELAGNGVTIVASAGNARVDTETIPACLAADPYSPVVSVGAGTSAENREHYSNHGSWVREWRTGTVTSLMPVTLGLDGDGNGFALWSGTSFSAGIVAGELAHARAAARAAGPPP
jgi:subtilisin family serine protease